MNDVYDPGEGPYKPKVSQTTDPNLLLDVAERHGRWQMNSSPGSSSSQSATSEDPASSAYDDSLIAIPPNLPAWNVKRHLTAGNPAPTPESVKKLGPWRGKENKLKTAHAALVLCLNIGVDPPDIVKTNPCAVLECWIDPFSLPPSKALEAIGKNLVHQFETLNPRMRYKHYPDPSVEDTKKFCITLRKMVKDERALFYYNGHGVPKPTPSGEIWVFNRGYTQYIPVSLQDLLSWLGSPTIYVWDCSAAGHILDNFEKFAKKRDAEPRTDTNASYSPFVDSIHLAACAADEVLPMAPDLPADVFTSALTSPIEMALRFYVLQNQARLPFGTDEAMKIPGDLKDRRTPLGELNWIFTAITDTIAWTTFPKELFKRLFRQDWTLAALFRNFLLAERIMRKYNCTPRAFPVLPPTHKHPLWLSWDLAVDKVMVQLPNLLAQQRQAPPNMDGLAPPTWQYENVASVFFEEHLQAFFVWLNRGGSAMTKRGPLAPEPANLPSMTPPVLTEEEIVTQNPSDIIASTTGRGKPDAKSSRDSILVPRKPPDQLPILLQVLLSQTHRLRALILLGNFIDLGPWAVHLALTIGIFPYVQKLLQSPAIELRPVLIYIWSRVIAFDQSVQVDLLKDNGHNYFSVLLKPDIVLAIPNELEHKAMCAFIMAMECRDHLMGQQACFHSGLLQSCLNTVQSEDYLMRQWSVLAIALLWDGFDEAKSYAVSVHRAHEAVELLIVDDAAEVRAAAFYALSTLFGASASKDVEKRGGGGMGSLLHLNERDHLGFEFKLAMTTILNGKDDASPMVRKEMLVLMSCIVSEYRGWFVVAAWAYWEGNRAYFADMCSSQGRLRRQRQSTDSRRLSEPNPDVVWNAIEDWVDRVSEDEEVKGHNHVVMSSVFILYATLLELSMDPYQEVANMARTVSDYVVAMLRDSPFAKLPGSTLNVTPQSDIPLGTSATLSKTPTLSKSATTSTLKRDATNAPLADGLNNSLSTTLKRTSSFATSLRNLAAGYAFPSLTDRDPQGGPDEADEDQASVTKRASQDPHPPRFEYRATVPTPHYHFTQYLSPYPSPPEEGKPQPSKDKEQNVTRATSATNLKAIGGQHDHERQGTVSTTSSPGTSSRLRTGAHFSLSGRQTPSEPGSSPVLSNSFVSFSAADIVEMLTEEDWERLRNRRRVGAQAREQHARMLIQQQQQRQQVPQQQSVHAPIQQGRAVQPGIPPQALSQLAQAHAAQQAGARLPLQHPLPTSNAVGPTATPMYMRASQLGQNAVGNGVGQTYSPQLGTVPPMPQAPVPQPNQPGGAMQSSWTSSSSSSFVTTDSDLSLGLGTGSGLANILPLKSSYFDWGMEYFTEPQMRAAENEEPGSVVWNEQSWRAQRNERILSETHSQGLSASRCQWDKSLVTLQNVHPVRTLKFHQFETHLVTSNSDRLISVWDWAKKKRIACFDNGNPEGTCVTSIHFINEDHQTQVLTGSADGVVRIFSNYDPETSLDDSPLELCSAWRVLPQLSFSDFCSGLVTDWLQPYGLLLVGGDSKVIKMWDAHKETCVGDIRTDTESCITSLAADLDGAAIIIAGAGDGMLCVYDRRTPSKPAIRLKAYEKHRSWVQSVHWQRGCDREILSARQDDSIPMILDGEVMLWDIRTAGGALVTWKPHSNGLASLAVHDHTAVFATTSALGKGHNRHQNLTIQSLPPLQPPMETYLKVPLQSSQAPAPLPHGFFPGQTSLAFHPHEMMVGWGGYDGRIKIFGCNLKERPRLLEPEVVLPENVTFGEPLPSISSSQLS
ncbi:hypothetical protein FRB99_003721 [Tulasnella sp. 403]|nr:hypothetical protein FRB99_003721 [Tulasnella sp. 403]